MDKDLNRNKSIEEEAKQFRKEFQENAEEKSRLEESTKKTLQDVPGEETELHERLESIEERNHRHVTPGAVPQGVHTDEKADTIRLNDGKNEHIKT